jgi:hypothetical protein
MAPRKLDSVFRVICIVLFLAFLVAPSVIARSHEEIGPGPVGGSGGPAGQIGNPPGGPTGGGGGDNGDPDDISILFNGPSDPRTISDRHNRTALPPVYSRITPYRAGAWYAFFWWTGIGW